MAEKSVGKSKLYLLVISLLILSVFLFLLSLFVNSGEILEEKKIATKLSIGNVAGFDVSKEELSFGMISQNVISYRNDMVVANNYNFPIKVEFTSEGNITPFLIFENEVYFEPGENKSILVSTVVGNGNQPKGNYSGTMKMIFKRVV